MHDEHRTGRHRPSGPYRAHLTDLPGPWLERSREGSGSDDRGLPGVLEQSSGVSRPIIEISMSTHCRHATDLWVDGRSAQGHGSTATETTGPDVANLGHLTHECTGGQHVIAPAVHREVSLRVAAATEGEHQRHPPHLGGDAIREFGERAGRKSATLVDIGKAVGEYESRHGGSRGDPWSGDMTRQLDGSGSKKLLHGSVPARFSRRQRCRCRCPCRACSSDCGLLRGNRGRSR